MMTRHAARIIEKITQEVLFEFLTSIIKFNIIR